MAAVLLGQCGVPRRRRCQDAPRRLRYARRVSRQRGGYRRAAPRRTERRLETHHPAGSGQKQGGENPFYHRADRNRHQQRDRGDHLLSLHRTDPRLHQPHPPQGNRHHLRSRLHPEAHLQLHLLVPDLSERDQPHERGLSHCRGRWRTGRRGECIPPGRDWHRGRTSVRRRSAAAVRPRRPVRNASGRNGPR